MLTDHLLVHVMNFLDTRALLIVMLSSRQALRCVQHVPCVVDFTSMAVPCDYRTRFRGARELILSRCSITLPCFRVICRGMPKLRKLDLSFCDGICDAAVEWAGHCCPGITHLNIARYRYSSRRWPDDATLRLIAELYTGILELNLGECIAISCTGLQYLGRRTTLTSLNLSKCTNVSDEGLIHASACTGLERLSIAECINVSGAGVLHIAQACLGLKYLDMSMCVNMDDSVLAHLGSELTHLNLHQFRHVGKEGLRNITASITHLKLGQPQWLHTGNIVDHDLEGCARCAHLTHLDLDMCAFVTDEGMKHVAKCHALTRLNLNACAGVTDTSMGLLGEGCPALTHINAGYCWVTDVGIKMLVAGCTLLSNISLQKCIYVTDESIFAMAQFALNLRHINVRGCSFVSKYGLRHLCERCTHLEFIDASLCWISDESWASKTCVAVTHLDWEFPWERLQTRE